MFHCHFAGVKNQMMMVLQREEAEDSGGKEEVADGMEASAGCGWGLLTGAVAGTGAGMGCVCASSSYCCEVRSTASMSASLSKESF